MAIDEGYVRYSCDVKTCGRAKYAKPGSDAAAQYVQRTYKDANGYERVYTFCQEHADAFDEITKGHDADYARFVSEGSVPNGE